MTKDVVLRPVAAADEATLLAWANDPATRAASRIHAAIAPADHRGWLARRLATPDQCRLWIGETDDEPIGVVRFERRTPTGPALEVSISVAPVARGRGLARPLLDQGIAAAREAFGRVTIFAAVLPGNTASLAVFDSAGFVRVAPAVGAVDDDGVVALELS